jgi:hypothetical protein
MLSARVLRSYLLNTILAVLTLSGCSKSPYELAPARGTVTIDGRPFTQGKVMFAPVANGTSQNAGKPAFGKLQSDGSFALRTDESDGAVVGEHWATVIAIVDETSAPLVNMPKFGQVTVPQRYKVEAARENQFDIKLSRQDVAKFGRK